MLPVGQRLDSAPAVRRGGDIETRREMDDEFGERSAGLSVSVTGASVPDDVTCAGGQKAPPRLMAKVWADWVHTQGFARGKHDHRT